MESLKCQFPAAVLHAVLICMQEAWTKVIISVCHLQRVYMPILNEDETGMAIRYASINTEHHILHHIVHTMVPIEPQK